MADPRAFLSFDADHDQAIKTLFAGQCGSSSPTPFVVEDWSSKEPLPQAEWERLIKEKINRTNMLIVLVGRFMASATGVHKEIEMAASQDVPYFGVNVDGASSSSNLPPGLARNRVIPWTWDGVGAAVDQMMGEGKNA